ncbi:MAG TPA: hypothetical protein VHM30_06085, partial [Gemmatimonadaceae bacterium]|nr:hypothetical protein [Gemmatimonadaceae bacterium]
NRGSSTIWVPACGDDPTVAIERGVGNGWEGYSGRFCPENLSQAPIELRAGQKRSSIVPLYEAGHFRLRLVYADEASKVANVGTVSNSFDVH